MNITTSLAWGAWKTSSHSAGKRFEEALNAPRKTRTQLLRRVLLHARGSRFAETHRLHPGLGPEEYAVRVPVMDTDALSTWTAPMLTGAQGELFGPPVERLVPTSGSTGPVKLIPMCAASRREYAVAVNLWMADLLRTAPAIRRGRAYIATSPALDSPRPDASIPVGFAEDEAYLGFLERHVLGALLVVPTAVARLRGNAWRQAVREKLFAARDLRLLSLWHPSYLDALFDPVELAELPERWPHLALISCWADGVCREDAERLHGLFPGARLHPKGLWLTEGVVTVPWRGQCPLALLNGYHEFEDEAGAPVPMEALKKGRAYRILLSNHAGLYRYRLGDLVEVSGHLGATPCFRWIGRADAVSDLRGEKLSEAQIERALAAAGIGGNARLVPDPNPSPPAYRLLTRDPSPDLAALESALCENPHYRWARELGQLGPVSPGQDACEALSSERRNLKPGRIMDASRGKPATGSKGIARSAGP